MNFSHQDEVYLRHALRLARKGIQTVSPNPAVGAVIVRDGEVIAEAWHKQAGELHAERLALESISGHAAGATLYVNLEPCCHWGQTPPCTDIIISERISRVVACTADPNDKVAGQGFEILRQAGIEVSYGHLEGRAEKLNEVFFHDITTGKPFVHVKAGVSLDGKIATSTGKSQWITSEKARLYAHRLRQRYSAILVGTNTVLIDDPSLNVRTSDGGSIHRVIIDSELKLPLTAKLFQQEAGGKIFIATSRNVTAAKAVEFEKAGATLLKCKTENGKIDLNDLMTQLSANGINSLMVEGGGETIASFLAAGLVNKMTLVYAPIVIGGRASVSVASGLEIDSLSEAHQLHSLRSFKLGPDIAIEGYLGQE
jgi:diaminohydroxyphosphoribosylaminopyrimidine deaminase/5-amino-6-(5-phosphoribosylamino)uracil reductase